MLGRGLEPRPSITGGTPAPPAHYHLRVDREPESWIIAQHGFDLRTFKAWEGLFTLGGTGLHVRGSLEEPLASAPQSEEYERTPANVTSEVMRHPISKWGTYMPGVYGRHPAFGLQLINLPWFLWLAPFVDGERLDMERCTVLSHTRTLDMKDGTLSRSLRWRTRSGKRIDIEHNRFISAAEPGACAQSMTVRSDAACDLVIESGIDADVRTNGFDHFKAVSLEESEGDLVCRVMTDRGLEIEIRSQVDSGQGVRVVRMDGRRAWLEMPFRLEADRPVSIEKRSHVRIVWPASEEGRRITCGTLPPPGTVATVPTREAQWRAFWDASDIAIEGDANSQRAIRAALFHLNRAHPGEDFGLAIDAKGYAGEAYWGHFFWDTEIYFLPFYLYTNPALARALLEFRARTLPAAIANARARGHAGAKYPWEAGPEGTEECPNPIYADQEIHITADVVYAMAHYVAATGDDEFPARNDVQRVLIETSRYWMSRIEWIDGRPHLLQVMGPDEYTPNSNDNAYTNMMVGIAMAFALENARRHFSPTERRKCGDGSNLPVLRHPDDPSLILQCENFHRLDDVDLDSIWKDRSRTLGAQIPLERFYRTKALKQADVILMMWLFEHHFTEGERRRAWEYYLPLTTHDSSLSPATHALFAARLGMNDDAWRFWQRACAIDLDLEHGGAAEGIHIANCGMLWQTVAFGFAGVCSAMHTDTLTLRPQLPRQWKSLRIPIVWRGNRFLIDLTHRQLRICNHGPWQTGRVMVNDEARHIALHGDATWDLRA